MTSSLSSFFFFFNDTATTEIYTLSLHDALPICIAAALSLRPTAFLPGGTNICATSSGEKTVRSLVCSCRDRKSTRLNSSHSQISYAVFCLKKKKNNSTYFDSVRCIIRTHRPTYP